MNEPLLHYLPLSGGQRTLAGQCYLFALAKASDHLPLYILDEW